MKKGLIDLFEWELTTDEDIMFVDKVANAYEKYLPEDYNTDDMKEAVRKAGIKFPDGKSYLSSGHRLFLSRRELNNVEPINEKLFI